MNRFGEFPLVFKTTYYRWRSSQCYLNSLINDPFLFLCYYRHVTSGTNNKVYCLNNPTSHFLTNFLQQSNRHYAMSKMLIFIGRAVRARWNPWNPLHCRFVYSILCSKRIINKPSCYVMLSCKRVLSRKTKMWWFYFLPYQFVFPF